MKTDLPQNHTRMCIRISFKIRAIVYRFFDRKALEKKKENCFWWGVNLLSKSTQVLYLILNICCGNQSRINCCYLSLCSRVNHSKKKRAEECSVKENKLEKIGNYFNSRKPSSRKLIRFHLDLSEFHWMRFRFRLKCKSSFVALNILLTSPNRFRLSSRIKFCCRWKSNWLNSLLSRSTISSCCSDLLQSKFSKFSSKVGEHSQSSEVIQHYDKNAFNYL